MTTATAPARRLDFIPSQRDGEQVMANLLTIKVGNRNDTYAVEPVKSVADGVAYAITKLDLAAEMPTYHVHVSAHDSTCDCPAGTYRGKCKHVDAIAKLIELGRLPGPTKPAPTPTVGVREFAEDELFESL